MEKKYGLSVDLLETRSTNCGNGITCLLDLLAEQGIEWQSILLMQDTTMMARIAATLTKYVGDRLLLNDASYQVTVREQDGQLHYVNSPVGMWPMEYYLRLLLGEIRHLRDDEIGYGPKGLGYLAHVPIHPVVEETCRVLQEQTGLTSREANPAYASPGNLPT